ncbi:single-stranded DNA-binding protein [Faecalibacterium sp. 9]|uniref:single-stranded DNA-binding protein n=1 Tax=Faecalibacterium sp. 9 TaxID=3402018 RepID=UPI003AB01A92
MLNVVAIMGRLVADPELRTTPAGVNVCQFRIACDRNFARQGEQRQTDFVDIVAWRQQADFVCKYFSKGSLIAINGRIQTRNYQDKNGNNRTAFAVVAENINFGGSKGTSSAKVDDGGEAAPRSDAWPKADPPANYGGVDDFAVIDDNDDLPF